MTDDARDTGAASAGAVHDSAPPPAGDGNGVYRVAEETIREALSEVYDPEIGIDIVSLGLVYGVDIDDLGILSVEMTLTTPFCPLGDVLDAQIRAVCEPLPGVEDVRINLVWAPPWDPHTMASDEAKLELGIY